VSYRREPIITKIRRGEPKKFLGIYTPIGMDATVFSTVVLTDDQLKALHNLLVP